MARGSRDADSDADGSQSVSEERSPLTPRKAALLRVQKRSSALLDCSSGDDTGSAGGGGDRSVAPASSVWGGNELSDPGNADVKMNNIRRYLRAARSLYDVQYQMKRPSAILKMKANAYGLKSRPTFDALAALVSPLRSRQVLDDWTGLEIGLFEEAYERFGKDFHAIAEQLPNKTVKDTIAFYYIWKKHGSCSKTRLPEGDGNLSDDFLPEPEPDVSSETLKLMDQLRKRQIYTQDYLDAARAMYSPQPVYSSNHKRQKLPNLGLQRVLCFQQALRGLSPLRVPSVLGKLLPKWLSVDDNWVFNDNLCEFRLVDSV
ncbi:hypothetical protein PHYBOEH_010962 [Phytophthora boehmeriae]|uniref:SANT domain-containing protein n=1 Tax=Phytophthora boehmeriae TaxID=109152 RepID=A0A8T1WY45_9STRA|nr:hypothetical protein PHYBOEH_010962 [Phytophthora boehmeriae]